MRKTIRLILAMTLVGVMLVASSCGKSEEKAVTPTDTAAVSSEEASSEAEHGYRPEPGDFSVNGIKFGMNPEEVKAVLGNPAGQTKGSANAIHGGYISMDYPGMNLWFNEYPETQEFLLENITVTGEDIMLVKGVHAGCTVDEILQLFDHPDYDFVSYAKTLSYSFKLYDSHDIDYNCFNPDWPDEPVYVGYYDDFEESDATIRYLYIEPPVWNDDKTEMTVTKYEMLFLELSGDDKVTEIQLSIMRETFTQ